jgi:hypothetical protein
MQAFLKRKVELPKQSASKGLCIESMSKTNAKMDSFGNKQGPKI